MTAPSPVTLATSIASWTITCNGSALDSSIQVVSIDVWSGVNRIPKARLVVSDGSAADQDFPISEGSSLIPGVTLTIALGYGGSETTVFTGVIHRQGLEVSINGPSRLVVEAADTAMTMTLARQNAVFQNVTDSQVCQTLITAAGLTASVTATSVTHETIVQYYATSWDTMVLRAQASGMVVTAAAGTVTVAPPDTGKAPVLTLTYGESILDFRAAMDASTQYTASAIQSVAWDPGTQALAKSGQAQSSVTTPGNISSAQLAAVFNVKTYLQQSAGDLTSSELTQWSSAELVRTQMAKIRGEVRFQGNALPVPGCMVTLAGLGQRFNGNGYVAGVHHRLSEGLWRTSLELGLSPDWFAATAPQLAAPGASGQLPPANNVQSGTVQQIIQDPDGEYRVLVVLPLLQAAQGVGVWARFGSFYASNGAGAAFFPEIGDEVVVAFLSGDPRYPVILGSLYSKKNPPPIQPANPNNVKTITSKSGMHIDFVEDAKEITLVTPGNQSVTINDQAKSITLTDMNGNSVTLNSGGITLNSAAEIKLTAKTGITLSAGTSLSLTGKTGATLSATSGMVQVKGTTVALNP
ncbi:type VI secretion system tip protein VgrG [Azospirillum largimobile]